ncbi:MAG TPA: BPSS1780 family membrane protein [Burkholderiales bacterium]
MEPRSVAAGRGVAWFGCGWRTFLENPAIWVVQAVLLLALFLVLAFVPLGGLLVTLAAPALAAGLLHGAAELQAGRTLEVGHLFRAFRDQRRLGPLLGLGAVGLAAGILSTLIGVGFLGTSIMSGEPPAETMLEHLGGRALTALLLILTVQLIAAALLYFAVPLVMFRGAAPLAAMQSSLRACLRNVLPLFVFSLIYALAAFAASLPFALGWLVLLPWSACMLYCSYRDIYGDGPGGSDRARP